MSHTSGDTSLDGLSGLARRLRQAARPQRRRGRGSFWHGSFWRELAITVAAGLVISLLIKTFLVQAFFIPSGSMEPTLHGCTGCSGDRVLVNKLSSHTGEIHRGDVVVFHDASSWLPAASKSDGGLGGHLHDALAYIGLLPSGSESDLVKRVIGVGGDTVEGRAGKVYVNGVVLQEPYVYPGDRPTELDFKVTVPSGKLWVMGDHRGDSADSRAHLREPGKGFVAESDVVGRAVAIVWPLGRAGSLSRPDTFDQPALARAP